MTLFSFVTEILHFKVINKLVNIYIYIYIPIHTWSKYNVNSLNMNLFDPNISREKVILRWKDLTKTEFF